MSFEHSDLNWNIFGRTTNKVLHLNAFKSSFDEFDLTFFFLKQGMKLLIKKVKRD